MRIQRIKQVSFRLLPIFLLACIGFTSQVQASIDSELFAGLAARNIGPAAISGRVTVIDVVESDTNMIYVGTASGGIWKSNDAGLTWAAIFEHEGVASIGALAINQKNPDIIWVGTGEGNTRNSVSVGDGMYKSLDGGQHWQKIGLTRTEHINRIALHPDNPEIAYVAAIGALWGDNEQRGIFKTSNGGTDWAKILYVDMKTGGTDIVMDPSNPNKLYAATWQVRRWPWYFESGGAGSGIYISHDGGDSWLRKTEEDGLPKGDLGRIVFAVSRSHTNIVYALAEAKKSAIIRSDDGGAHWTKVNEDKDVATRPFYFGELEVDPVNPNRVYNIAFIIKISEDGGKTFKPLQTMLPWAGPKALHVDHHSLWINPNDPRHLIDGNDGGVGISHNYGSQWQFVSNLPLAQFYHIAVDNEQPYNVYGGLQDNGSWKGPSQVWENGGIRNFHWQEVLFGDGFDTIPDPRDPMIGYAMSQKGFLARWNMHTGQTKDIQPVHSDPEIRLRFNWNAGFELDPFNPDVLYFGSQFIHKSTDKGDTWEIISQDMTSNNPQWQQQDSSGGLILDATGAENFTSIVSIAASSIKQGVIWVGTDDGYVHVTQNGGSNWNSIAEKVRGVPKNTWVPHIEPSPHDPSMAFVVFDNHRRSDMKSYVYRVENYGKKWVSLSDQSIQGYALSIQQDPVDPNLLFLGTEFGLFVSLNAGDTWFKWTQGVPTVSVMDIALQDRETDLVLGTHGRGVFIVDNYSALRHLSEKSFEQAMTLLAVKEGQQYRIKQSPSTRFVGSGGFRAENRAYGVMIDFMLADDDLPHPNAETERQRLINLRAEKNKKIDDAIDDSTMDDDKDKDIYRVLVEIFDADNTLIRSFKSEVHQGINRIVWNMAIDSFKLYPVENKPKELPSGIEALPGKYSFNITFRDNVLEGVFEVLADPRFTISIENRQKNFQALMHLGKLNDLNVAAIDRIKNSLLDIEQLLSLAKRVDEGDKQDKRFEALSDLAKPIKKELLRIEDLLWARPGSPRYAPKRQVSSKIDNAFDGIYSHWDVPTEANYQNIQIAQLSLSRAVDMLNAVIDDTLVDFRKKAAEYHLMHLPIYQPLIIPETFSR